MAIVLRQVLLAGAKEKMEKIKKTGFPRSGDLMRGENNTYKYQRFRCCRCCCCLSSWYSSWGGGRCGSCGGGRKQKRMPQMREGVDSVGGHALGCCEVRKKEQCGGGRGGGTKRNGFCTAQQSPLPHVFCCFLVLWSLARKSLYSAFFPLGSREGSPETWEPKPFPDVRRAKGFLSYTGREQ